jgi:hypothetical protein
MPPQEFPVHPLPLFTFILLLFSHSSLERTAGSDITTGSYIKTGSNITEWTAAVKVRTQNYIMLTPE